VYALFGTGDLIALVFSGKRIWAKNIGVPDNHYGHSSSLIMYREKLIVQYDHKKSAGIKAFKGSTGELVWNTDRNVKASWASPVIIRHNGKAQIVLAADPMVVAYNPGNGKELWRSECIFGEVGPSVCFDDGVVYVVNDYAQIAAIQVDNPGEPLWTNTDILSDIPSPVAANGLLIMPTSYGLLGCYEGKSGELLWEHEFDESTFASPILIGTRVYLLDTGGTMHIFRLSGKGYEAIAENRLGENTVATPAFAAGRIYIRTDEHLYCIGNK
jgi:outer membrane protein assembly factor BamB